MVYLIVASVIISGLILLLFVIPCLSKKNILKGFITIHEKEIELLISILTILGAFMPMMVNNETNMNILRNDIQNVTNIISTINNTNENNVDANISADNSIENNYYTDMLLNYKDISVETLLMIAEIAYIGGNYELASMIYGIDKLADNPIRNCNLGYFFANGIYVTKDFAKAEKYYDEAIVYEHSQSIRNKLALYIKNNSEMDRDIKENYINLPYNNDHIISYLKNEKCLNNENINEYINSLNGTNFYELSDTEKKEYIVDSFYKWSAPILNFFYEGEVTTAYNKYEYSHQDSTTNGSYVYYYYVYTREFININLLNENFCYMNDNSNS